MFLMFMRPQQKPKEAEAQQAPARPTLPLPEELREALQAALGYPIPQELTREQAEALMKDVASKAPALHRDLVEIFLQKYRDKVRNKPAPKTARPPGIIGWFYVRDSNGNWVPSRIRYMSALFAAAGVFFAIIYFSLSDPIKPKQPATPTEAQEQVPVPATDSAPAVSTLPQPPSQPPSSAGPSPTAPTQAGGQSAGSASPASQVPSPPDTSPLPPPPSDLPPPPDYEGAPQASPNQEGPTVVLYRREPVPAQDGQAQEVNVASLGRPVGEMLAASPSQASQTSQETAEQGASGQGGQDFWRRNQPQTQETQPFWVRESKDQEKPVSDSPFWTRAQKEPAAAPSSASGGSPEGFLLPQKPSADIQVVWSREKPQSSASGGIIPPARANTATPLSQPAPQEAPSPGNPTQPPANP